jgi:hypothetical protein
MSLKQQRLPRFLRHPELAGAFQMTPRDVEILRHVAEHRFIRSEWLIELVGGSRQQVLRRLNLLFHHSYLERPRAQLDYYHEGGSKSLVYGLASRGAGRLRRDLDMPFHRMDWTTRNKRVGRLFLEHTLMVSDFMASLEIECRLHSNLRLRYGHELTLPAGREKSREPFRWTVDLPGKRRVGVVPDKVFAIEVKSDLGETRSVTFYLEADQGTMPIERRDLRQSCVLRKLKSYEATSLSGLQRKGQGSEYFKVIFVAKSEARRMSIQTAIPQVYRTRRMFTVFGNEESAVGVLSGLKILQNRDAHSSTPGE